MPPHLIIMDKVVLLGVIFLKMKCVCKTLCCGGIKITPNKTTVHNYQVQGAYSFSSSSKMWLNEKVVRCDKTISSILSMNHPCGDTCHAENCTVVVYSNNHNF